MLTTRAHINAGSLTIELCEWKNVQSLLKNHLSTIKTGISKTLTVCVLVFSCIPFARYPPFSLIVHTQDILITHSAHYIKASVKIMDRISVGHAHLDQL